MYRNEGFKERGGGFAPVHVGEEVDVKIEAVGEKGDGIAKVKGFVLFVPNTKQGDEVKIKITKVLRKVGFGEVVGAGSSHESKDTDEEESSYKDNESEVEESEGKESEGNADDADYSDEGSEEFGEDEEA
jgi:predicted RNA-binding protein with TRAM domain